MGSKEDVAARIEADTRVKIEEMKQAVTVHKDNVSLYKVRASKSTFQAKTLLMSVIYVV